jgi:hypothetical protein
VVLGFVNNLVQTVMYAEQGAFYNKTGAKELLEVRSSGLKIARIGSHYSFKNAGSLSAACKPIEECSVVDHRRCSSCSA